MTATSGRTEMTAGILAALQLARTAPLVVWGSWWGHEAVIAARRAAFAPLGPGAAYLGPHLPGAVALTTTILAATARGWLTSVVLTSKDLPAAVLTPAGETARAAAEGAWRSGWGDASRGLPAPRGRSKHPEGWGHAAATLALRRGDPAVMLDLESELGGRQVASTRAFERAFPSKLHRGWIFRKSTKGREGLSGPPVGQGIMIDLSIANSLSVRRVEGQGLPYWLVESEDSFVTTTLRGQVTESRTTAVAHCTTEEEANRVVEALKHLECALGANGRLVSYATGAKVFPPKAQKKIRELQALEHVKRRQRFQMLGQEFRYALTIPCPGEAHEEGNIEAEGCSACETSTGVWGRVLPDLGRLQWRWISMNRPPLGKIPGKGP